MKLGKYKVSVPLWAALSLVGFIAVALSVLKTGNKFIDDFLLHFLTAIAIACIIGATIDLYLKRKLAEDVFEAAFGYALPNDLKEEMRAIYSNKVICKKHIQHVKLEKVGEDKVRITVSLERELQNVTDNTENFSPKLGINDWFLAGYTSRILEVKYRIDGLDSVAVDLRKNIEKRDGGMFLRLDKTLRLRPRQKITVWQSYEEYMVQEAQHVVQFSHATLNPSVQIEAPPEFTVTVSASHRSPMQASMYGGRYDLPGLLLPHQPIVVRWWRRQQNDHWLNRHLPSM